MNTLNWGLIATGNIARTFARGLSQSTTGKLLAVASRSQENADRFGDEFGVVRRYGAYQDLLNDAEINAVYISTPHPQHVEWAIKSAQAKKHILCEKPLALNHAQTRQIIDAARENGVFLMEAFMYRVHPQTHRLHELIRQRAIGETRLIQCTFSFFSRFNPESRLHNNALGGGAILDVGSYCTSMARLIAGATLDRPFAEPVSITGAGHIGPGRVDDYAAATLKFENGVVAQLACGIQLNMENTVRVHGTEGHLELASPWVPAKEGGTVSITLHKKGQPEPESIDITTERNLYALEADAFAEALEKRQSPHMSWDDTLGNMQTLDAWRRAVGVKYDGE